MRLPLFDEVGFVDNSSGILSSVSSPSRHHRTRVLLDQKRRFDKLLHAGVAQLSRHNLSFFPSSQILQLFL